MKTLREKEHSDLLFHTAVSIACAVILAIIVFGIVHSRVFPSSRFVGIFDGEVDTAISFLIYLGVLIVGVGAVCFVLAARRRADVMLYRNATKHQAMVVVISKTHQVAGSLYLTRTKYTISFEFPDKSRRSFAIDAMPFELIREGETGMLTYRQNRERLFFISFQPATADAIHNSY